MKNATIMKTENLVKWFPLKKGLIESIFSKQENVHAVDNVDLEIKKGEIFGLVGESGCGKTTLGRLLLKLIEPTSGKIYFNEKDIVHLKNKKEQLEFRKKVQVIMQDPYESLSPRRSVRNLITEPLVYHKIGNSKEERNEAVTKVLEDVELPTTKDFLNCRPRDLSGGQRQRVAIARRLILQPEFMVADEPVSMLDASIKSSILNMMTELKEKYDTTYLLITHDVSIAWHMCDRLAAMYLGNIIEQGEIENVINEPLHPYTQALISAVPTTDPSTKCFALIDEKIKGEIQTPINPPSGCRFHPRCPKAMKKCSEQIPTFVDTGNNHKVACLLYD